MTRAKVVPLAQIRLERQIRQAVDNYHHAYQRAKVAQAEWERLVTMRDGHGPSSRDLFPWHWRLRLAVARLIAPQGVGPV